MQIIAKETVSADENPQYGNSKKYGTDPGITTNDKVFLLSAVEALSYFPTDTDRRCQPTAYAVARGSKVSSNNGNCWQWLRTPGCYQDQACHVGTVGTVMLEGSRVNAADGCVRPAIWISIS